MKNKLLSGEQMQSQMTDSQLQAIQDNGIIHVKDFLRLPSTALSRGSVKYYVTI